MMLIRRRPSITLTPILCWVDSISESPACARTPGPMSMRVVKEQLVKLQTVIPHSLERNFREVRGKLNEQVTGGQLLSVTFVLEAALNVRLRSGSGNVLTSADRAFLAYCIILFHTMTAVHL